MFQNEKCSFYRSNVTSNGNTGFPVQLSQTLLTSYGHEVSHFMVVPRRKKS